MKLRHPLLLKVGGLVMALVARLWGGSIRLRPRCLGPDVRPDRRGQRGRFLYAFWHEDLLVATSRYARPDLCVLISKHADGELVAHAARHLRVRIVRGSTKGRDGVAAVRALVREAALGHHLAVTPDGPRGPRRVVQPGVVAVAARTGLPVVAAGFAYSACRRARSWDRFVLPRPFGTAWLVLSEPIAVPPDAARGPRLEEYRRRVQEAMDRAGAAASQRSAVSGQLSARQETEVGGRVSA